jgi:hypothetical protein
LHTAVGLGAHQRTELEHLCRYITRPAIANERLKRTSTGDVVLQFKTPYKDGTSHMAMSPLDFMQRLAALVPRPRLHLTRFHGVLAPRLSADTTCLRGLHPGALAPQRLSPLLDPEIAPPRGRSSADRSGSPRAHSVHVPREHWLGCPSN